MKKVILIICLASFCAKISAQSLTLKDLFLLKQQQSAKTFLTQKDFSFSDYGHGMERYVKNTGTPLEEKANFNIYKGKAYISYTTPDTTYMHKMIKELSAKYRLILKDASARETYYRFGDLTTNIQIDIVKTPDVHASIQVGSL